MQHPTRLLTVDKCIASILANNYMISPPFNYGIHGSIDDNIRNLRSCIMQLWAIFRGKDQGTIPFNIDKVVEGVSSDLSNIATISSSYGFIMTGPDQIVKKVTPVYDCSTQQFGDRVFVLFHQLVNKRIFENITDRDNRLILLSSGRKIDERVLILASTEVPSCISGMSNVSIVTRQKNGRFRFIPKSSYVEGFVFPKGSIMNHTQLESVRYLKSQRGALSATSIEDVVHAAELLYKKNLRVIYVD